MNQAGHIESKRERVRVAYLALNYQKQMINEYTIMILLEEKLCELEEHEWDIKMVE